MEYHILAPRTPDENGRALYAPYGLAKVEAALVAAGFRREDVIITPPEKLEKVVDKDTEILGIHTVDPQGLAPVSWTLRVMTGGGKTCTALEFEKLMEKVKRLKKRYGFRVVVGGPGVWQLRGREDKFGIDVVYDGEAELDFPLLVKKILGGERVPRYVAGRIVPPDEVPPIITPSRNGLVQITRGCPRGCQFCKPTTFFFRSIPLDTVLREAELNARTGAKVIEFVTEDVLLYGAKGLHLNGEAVKKLFTETYKAVKNYGVEQLTFSHITLSSALVLKDAVRFISDINGLSEKNPVFPQVGLESGSPRIVAKYFRGKPYPWKPEDWPWVVIEGSKLLNDNYMYPCLTYIIGFPDATPEDYVKTTELIDRLVEEGFRGWIYPLFLVPIGGTRIEKRAEFMTWEKIPQEAVEAIVAGWEHSIRFSKYIYPVLLRGLKNPLVRRIVNALIGKALDAMRTWIRGIKEDPRIVKGFSEINIRDKKAALKIMTRTMVTQVPRILRRRVAAST